jgi:DNA polymerase
MVPAETTAGLAALLDWWRAAGVDVTVRDTPYAWLAPAGLTEAAPPARMSSVSPVSARPAVDPFAHVTSLADLAALVRAEVPNAPFADGDPASGLMIMGEAPSAEDLRTGRPFTGPAGQLLDRMLAAIALDRSSCYIALLAPRRRLPGPPSPDDIEADLPLARAHVRLAAPRLLLLLGASASQSLTGATAPITRLRGSWLEVDGVPALATFNPAYLLRRPEEKAHAWADLLAFKRRLSA